MRVTSRHQQENATDESNLSQAIAENEYLGGVFCPFFTHTQLVDELPVPGIPPATWRVTRHHLPPGASAGLGGSAGLAEVANESWLMMFIVQIQKIVDGIKAFKLKISTAHDCVRIERRRQAASGDLKITESVFS